MARVTARGIDSASGLTAPTVFHSGQAPPVAATSGTDTTPVVTETYVSSVFVACNTDLTGIAVLNGSAVAGNMTVALADSTGGVIANSASTAASGTAAYQQVPFTAPIKVKGPGLYYILVQNNNTSNRFRSHPIGNFRAGKLTSQVYGTLPPFTPPTGFTADLGPIASTY
jgi:hypothetical protein